MLGLDLCVSMITLGAIWWVGLQREHEVGDQLEEQ